MPSVIKRNRIEAYVDGSCLKPNQHGAWAYMYTNLDGDIVEGWKSYPSTTNNQMELSALIHLLRRLKTQGLENEDVVVKCDSQYVVLGIREWLPGWIKRGWRRADGKPVKNMSLWKELHQLVMTFDKLSMVWVKGHAGDEGNERVDWICNTAARELKAKTG